MKFKATEEQVKKIAVLAVENSLPVGMGFVHHKPDQKFTPEMFEVKRNGLFLDYVQGRMVKLDIIKVEEEENVWQINGNVNSEYQSWCNRIVNYESLVMGIKGVELVRDGE